MPSPDFSRYIDLTPLDVDPVNIYLGAIELARITMPEFTLRQGTIEDTIFQAMSMMTAIATGAINRLPDRLMVGMGELLGYSAYPGSRATVDVTITLTSSDGLILPAGTVFSYTFLDAFNERFQYTFELIDSTEIASATSPTLASGTATLQANLLGNIPLPGLGSELTVLTTNTSIGTVVVTAQTTGTEPDNPANYLNSITTYFASLSGAVATRNQAENLLLSQFRQVKRCRVYDLTNPSGTLQLSDPDVTGYMTAFVYGANETISAGDLTDIQEFLEERISASLISDTFNFTTYGVSARVNAAYDSVYQQSDIEASIESVLTSYLSPLGFPEYETKIRSKSLFGRISQLEGVLYVNSIYLQPVGAGFTEKQWADVRVATTTGITIATGLNAGDVIDGVTLVNGDRVLVKDQGTQSQNGIYVVSASPARATDADESAEFAQNKLVYVSEGTANGGDYFKQTTSTAITVGTTNIAFGAGTPYEELSFVYKGSLPDSSLGTITSTLTAEVI